MIPKEIILHILLSLGIAIALLISAVPSSALGIGSPIKELRLKPGQIQEITLYLLDDAVTKDSPKTAELSVGGSGASFTTIPKKIVLHKSATPFTVIVAAPVGDWRVTLEIFVSEDHGQDTIPKTIAAQTRLKYVLPILIGNPPEEINNSSEEQKVPISNHNDASDTILDERTNSSNTYSSQRTNPITNQVITIISVLIGIIVAMGLYLGRRFISFRKKNKILRRKENTQIRWEEKKR